MSRKFLVIGVFLLVGSVALLLFQLATTSQPNQDLTTESPPAEPLITHAQVTDQCQVEVSIGLTTILLPTSFDPTVAKCDKYTVSKVSPSGTFVAFEDLSASGVDAVVSLYDLNNNRVFTLDDYGSESVLDMLFLPNNRLLVLYSQGISGKQNLRLYDTPALEPLLKDVPVDGDLSSETLNPFVFERNLEDAKGIAKSLRLTGDAVVLVDEQDDITNPIFSINLSEL